MQGKREKSKCWRVFESALKIANIGTCEEEGYTSVASTCCSLLGCSPKHAGSTGREMLSIYLFFVSLLLLIGLCYFVPQKKDHKSRNTVMLPLCVSHLLILAYHLLKTCLLAQPCIYVYDLQ